MPEKFKTAPAEQEEVGKLELFIATLAERYRALEVPIENDGRIDMQAYTNIHSDVAKDIALNEKMDARWREQGQTVDRRQTDGEKLEMLAYAIFAKNMGEQFIVARSSVHDNRINKIDTLLLDSKTGNLVCAFDEVSTTNGVEFENKQTAVQNRNLKGGTSLKYGIGIEEKGGGKTIIKTSATNIPIFYIALPKDRIEKGIQEFLPDIEKQSGFEQKLFEYFASTLSMQIQALELHNDDLNPDLQVKITAFKKVLSDLSLKKEKGK